MGRRNRIPSITTTPVVETVAPTADVVTDPVPETTETATETVEAPVAPAADVVTAPVPDVSQTVPPAVSDVAPILVEEVPDETNVEVQTEENAASEEVQVVEAEAPAQDEDTRQVEAPAEVIFVEDPPRDATVKVQTPVLDLNQLDAQVITVDHLRRAVFWALYSDIPFDQILGVVNEELARNGYQPSQAPQPSNVASTKKGVYRLLNRRFEEEKIPNQAKGILRCLEAHGGSMTYEELVSELGGFVSTVQDHQRIVDFYKKRLKNEGFLQY